MQRWRERVKILSSAPTARSRGRHMRQQTWTGQVFDWASLGWVKSWMGQAEESILQVHQQIEFTQTEKWEKYPNRSRQLYETLLPEILRRGMHSQEWPAGKRIQRVKFSLDKTAYHRITRRTLMAQSPTTIQNGSLLFSKVRQTSTKAVQPVRSQPPA